MKYLASNTRSDLQIIPKTDTQKTIENHKKAAMHFVAAAKSHTDAAAHHTNEQHDKAARSTIEAHGHSLLAHEAQKEYVQRHTMMS